MTRFRDRHGRDWSLELTVGMLEQLKADADFDLDELAERPEAAAAALYKRPSVLARVLWVLCEEQAARDGIDPREFGRSLDRPALDRGADAFLEEFVLFYPRSSAGRAIAGRLPEVLRRMDEEMGRAAAAEIDRALSPTATASPASSASTPAG